MKLTLEGRRSLGWLCRMFSAAVAVLVLATGCGTEGGSGTVPATAGTTWSITPAGGTFQTNDGRVTLIVPANAVATPVTVTPRVSSSPGTGPASYTIADGTFVQFNSVTFAQPVTLRFRIPASVPDSQVPFVRVFRKPDGSNTWQALARTLNIANRTIEVQTSQFSGFAVFTPGPNDWSIDPQGGNFTGAGNRIGLTVVAGAVNNLYVVRHTPIAPTDIGDSPAGWRYVQDSAFDFVWSDPTTQFTSAATYRIRFAGLNIPCDQSLVAIFTRTDFGSQHQWVQNATGINTSPGEATLLVNRLQQHALFCPEPVLPVHTVTRTSSQINNEHVNSLQVSRLDGTAFVPVASQSYVRDQYSSTVHFSEDIVRSGAQVSAESLYVVTTALDSSVSGGMKQLVALKVDLNTIEVIDSIPGPTLTEFVFTPGISPDGSVVATKIQELDSNIVVTRRALRVYSLQSPAPPSETDLPTTDVADVEAVGNNGVVVLSDRRYGGTNVTLVRNGSVQMQIPGVMPRLNREATKMYVLNGGQIEEHDLTNGQQGAPIPISPVDYAIQTGKVIQFRQTTTGCELVSTDILTRQETVMAPSVDCPGEQPNSATYMLR